MEVRVISNVTKFYPHMIKVMIYKTPVVCPISGGSRKRNKHEIDDENYQPHVSSINRTKVLVRDLTLCNDFEWFCTFTFDPKRGLDVYDLQKCWHVMDRFLSHQRERSDGELRYLIVPEQHKSGAWHFHALLAHFNGIMRDSGHLTPTGLPVYNITSFRAGFSTATKIQSRESVANYVTKYITKDFVTKFNQRRFFCSRNLVRPTKELNSKVFELTLPLFRHKVGEDSERQFYNIDVDTI